MVQKTDLNVSPYYDDFDETDNFSRVLFRPGFAIQARELTQLQSTFQNQIEKFGSHVFAEGAMVIPGNTELNLNYYSLKLASTFASETVDPSQYFNSTTPVTLTGETSGVTAVVIGFDVATTTDQPTLYLRYLATGTDNVTAFFADGENISANSGITHTTSYSSNIASATTFTSSFSAAAGSSSANLLSSTGPASRKGSALVIQAGVYYIRGMFVTCSEETFVLDKYSDIPSYRVGFTISETLVTPESDTTLLDNSTGSSNFAAKGAHRLQISLALSKLDRGSVADSTFVQLLDVKNGQIQSQVRTTEYSVLEETLARRTFDESGNYTVRPFQFSPKESVTTSVRNEEFVGAFTSGATTDDGNTASSDLLSLQVSPGKAYVGGFEIELIAPTFKDINKARDFDTVNAGVSTFDLGNFANITNVYGAPDVTFISGESTAFKTLELYDDTILTRGTARGDLIGVARARAMEYSSGAVGSTSSNDTSVFKLYMFDIRPFTKLTLSGIPSPTLIATHSDGGVLVTGNTSGATGFVFGSSTSGTTVNLTNVVGAFTSGEKLIASDSTETGGLIETVADADITISEIRINTFSDIRSVYMQDADAGQDFTADFVTEPASGEEGSINLDGTDANGANAGDDVQVEDQTGGVEAIGREVISVARLKDAEKNRAMFKLPKKVIKTLLTATNGGATDTQYTVRRQFIGTTNSSGVITFTAGSNETFTSFAEKDYTLSILTAGDGTGVQGDIVTLSGGKIAGTGTAAITITDDTILADSAKVKLFATILKTSVSQKTKTTNLMKQVKVLAGASDAFGTRPTDRSVSLGRADVFNLAAVFDSEDISVDATAPTLTIGTITGTFTRGEKITGSATGATGRIISTSSPMSFVSTSNTNFNTSDTITGESSGASAAVSATTVGSDVITSRYTLDTGQRDNYYDIARIVRRPGSSAPTGRLLIIHDYLEHGSGDVMTVDSYTDIANQMDYEDIPTYSATKVDPDAPKPSGEFPLTDTYDFRPRVEDITGASTTLANIDEITGNSFDFFHRQYDGAGSSTVDVCQPGASIQSDFEFHLPKIAVLSMNSSGEINIVEGVGAEEPITPKCPDSSMKLATIFLPAFTFKPTDVSIIREKNQRFTMRDIGELERRLDHVEYYTALNLLERDAESFEVTDANGLNRFKSGFVVDNFSGHRLGDTEHKDYRCAMDMQLGHLRPKHITKGLFLEESVSSDADRTLAGYQKTGDLITLPYTEEVFADQPYASRIEKVAPLLTAEWVGKIVLTPDSDEWFETEVAPELVVNVEGNFNAVASAPENQVGTVWNAWQTQWSGVVGSSTTTTGVLQSNTSITRVATTTRTDLARTGMRTDVIEQIDRESQGFRVISRALIPILRARTIVFSGTGFRPNTRLYVFFDKVNVNSFVTPLSDTYSTDTTVIAGSPLITTAVGKVEGNFEIPDPKIEGNLQFKTGELQFRLTSSSKNLTGSDASADTNSTADALADQLSTAGNAIYTAKGILETEQETIIATRNAIVSQIRVNQTTSTQSTSVTQRTNIFNDDGNDPLAQTFIVQSDSNSSDGRFLTSVDIYFSNKDDTLPVTLEIRNVINGYPGQKILPFGRVVKDAVDINTSSTAATATKFTFTSPVYVQSGVEYCIALLTNSAEHKVWIARMGETDVGGSRTISEQPYTGVLFKSSNNSTWSPSQLEDLKFTIRTAKFSAGGSGTLTLQNEAIPVRTLKANSILLEDGSTVVKVKHVDHHMYSTSNNVTIDGVKSGASTTLNGSITAAATTLTLTSGTNFDDTTGKYSNDASSEWYIKIGDEIMKYTAISTNAVSGISRGQNSTTAAVHADGATVELYIIHRVPLTEINATHTSIANIGIDSYTISTTSSPVINGSTALVNSAISSTTALVVDGNRGTIEVGMTVTGTGISGSVTIATVTNQNTLVLSSAQSLSDNVVLTFTKGGVAEIGGSVITATENAIIDYAHTMVGALELPGTTISPSIRPTTATSAGGSQTSFSTLTAANARTIPLNDNYKFDLPHMVCSGINETNELSGLKSTFVPITLTTTSTTVSPVIDLQRLSLLAVANRLNNVDSSSDVYPSTEFFASTEPEGDNNAAIYLTKQIALENPATALKIIFAAHRPATSEIKVLYKLLRTDDASDFDDLSYRFFNIDGSPDQTVPASADNQDFREYVFTSGVTDDGLGEPLEEFIAFQIKIVMQGTNSAEPPRIKELRALALVT
jgi:hypothetical protein